jgi:hypothetical protein
MIIRGNPGRVKIIALMGFFVASMSLGAAFYLAWQKTAMELAWTLIALFLFVVISITSFTRKFNDGLISLSREGITIMAGFRTIPVAWENLESIETIEYTGRKYLAVKLKDLAPLQKLPQSLARLNAERTGHHFCLAGSLFEKPLEEIRALLTLYLGDTSRRRELTEEK